MRRPSGSGGSRGRASRWITGVRPRGRRARPDRRPTGFEPSRATTRRSAAVAADPDEDLPWPEAVSVGRWWRENAGRFAGGSRYLLGRPVGRDAAEAAFRDGRQRQRKAAAYELAVAEPGRCRLGADARRVSGAAERSGRGRARRSSRSWLATHLLHGRVLPRSRGSRGFRPRPAGPPRRSGHRRPEPRRLDEARGPQRSGRRPRPSGGRVTSSSVLVSISRQRRPSPSSTVPRAPPTTSSLPSRIARLCRSRLVGRS